MRFIVVSIIAVVVCSVTHGTEMSNLQTEEATIENDWQDFKKKFGKMGHLHCHNNKGVVVVGSNGRNYSDAEEEAKRRKIFAENRLKVNEHNKKFEAGEVTYSMELNHLSDKLPEEMLNGIRLPPSLPSASDNSNSTTESSSDPILDPPPMVFSSAPPASPNSHKHQGDEEFSESDDQAGIDSDWQKYKEKFGRSYSKDEDDERKVIFSEARKMIKDHNRKYAAGKVTYKMGQNEFTDKKKEEMHHMTGFAMPPNRLRSLTNNGPSHNTGPDMAAASYDLLEMTPTGIGEEPAALAKDWKTYKKKFGRNYTGDDEERRKTIFQKSRKLVQENNEKYFNGESTFMMHLSQFSDKYPEELSGHTATATTGEATKTTTGFLLLLLTLITITLM